MSLRLFKYTTLLALIATPAVLFAQGETSSKEEERLEALARDGSEWYAPKNSLTVGFRVLSSGVNVQFGKLGTVDFNTTVAPTSDGVKSRVYNNGYVNLDAPRAAELDSAGNQISTPGDRYRTTGTVQTPVTDSSGNVIGTVDTTIVTNDSLSYTPGLSRNWSYASAEQALLQPGYIALSSYSASSDGEFRNKKQGPSPGVELQFAHVLGRLSKRTEWSFVAGITLNGINNKTAGDVLSTLNTVTDYYSLNGQPAPATSTDKPYVGPSYGDLLGSDGTVVSTGGLETTVPVSETPVTVPGAAEETHVAGAATVHGKWQVKGAYFMVRVGPSVRSQVTERFGVSASLGVAGAYAGTHYTAEESFEVPEVGTSISTSEYSDASKFLSGFYADVNVEWTANERTGLFGGLSAQKFGDYGQTLGSRTARIDLGTSVGIRGGVSIKF